MSALADIKFLGWIIEKFSLYKEKEREKTNEAISAIHFAWSRTYDYLRNNEGDYIPNQELSDCWNDAARCTRLIDPDLAMQLKINQGFGSTQIYHDKDVSLCSMKSQMNLSV